MATVDRTAGRELGLIERDDLLAALHGAHSEVRTGQGRLVLVAGEAGAGKTALVRAFGQRAQRRGRVLWGSSDPLAAPQPLGAFADVARQTGGALGDLTRGRSRTHEVFAAVCDELDPSTVLVLEDLHWADEATLDVVRMLGRRIADAPGLVVATYRDDELGRAHPLRVTLGDLASAHGVVRLVVPPLSQDGVSHLASGTDVDAEALHRLTSGNAFLVTEVLGTAGGEIPATVTDAVLARTARLGEGAMSVLSTIALAPGGLEPVLLEHACAGAERELDECFAAGLLVERSSGVAFRHEISRLAVERTISPTLRRALHRRLLDALEHVSPPDLTRLAHHADGAGDADAVLRYAPRAAEAAAGHGAYREAAAQYGRALRFAGSLSPDARAGLLMLQSDALYNTDDQVESVDALDQAVALYREAGDVPGEGGALARLTSRLGCRALMAEAGAAAERAVRLLEPLPECPQLGAAHAAQALIFLWSGDHPRAIDAGRRAADIAGRWGDQATELDARITEATARYLVDGPGGDGPLVTALEGARAARDPMSVAWAIFDQAAVAASFDLNDDAERYISEGLDQCWDSDLDMWRLSFLALRARRELDAGEWTAASDIAAELAGDVRDSPEPRLEGLLILALIRARRGDPGVHDALDRAERITHSPDDVGWNSLMAVTRAEIAWLEGRPELVDEITKDAFAAARATGGAGSFGGLACWRRRAGIDDGDVPGVEGPHAMELTGRYREAAAAWAELGRPYEAALALGLSDDEEALRSAHAELRTLGASAAATAVARRLRERGVRGVARGPRMRTRENPADLTDRQMDVLALLGEGLTNAQIARRLFLSPRTVDHHVAAILRKLGVPSRARAGVEAARLGIGAPDL